MLKIFVSLLLLSSVAFGAWSPRAIDYANQKLGYFPGPAGLSPEERGALATVWGGGMREVRFNEDLSGDEQNIKLPGYFERDLRVFLRKQDHRAPLIVVVPGVFSNADDALARGTTKWFSKLGYHVLTLPNCWSRDFARAKPLYHDDYPVGEARTVMQVTRWAIKEIGAENISSAQLFGESLGALVVSVVYSLDSQESRPLFTAGATMTWPPIALHSAMQVLDGMMTSTAKLYDDKCHNLIKRLETKWRILRGKYILDPTHDEIECAPAVVAQYAFRKELVKLAKTVNHVNKLGRNVPKDLTFAKYVADYAPRYRAALAAGDHYGDLRYWLSKTSARGLQNIRILTSEDDFLNDHQSWDMPGQLDSPQDQLIVAHWGGHIGLTDTREYEGLMRAEFSLQ